MPAEGPNETGRPDAAKPAWAVGPPLSDFSEDGAATLIEALLEAGHRHPDQSLTCVHADGLVRRWTYPQLLVDARRVLAGLHAQGVKPGDPVILQLDRGEHFFPALWGCVLGGAIPTSLGVAGSGETLAAADRRLVLAWELLDRPLTLTSVARESKVRDFASRHRRTPQRIATVERLLEFSLADPHRAAPHDRALLLFTSGSSGAAKGVQLTHRNLLAMARGTAITQGFSSADVTLNWMPLDHVGALSFLHTMPIFLGASQVHIETAAILRDVTAWLTALESFGATIAWAPHFAFRLLTERAAAIRAGNWNLSRLRYLVNAGEFVSPRAARDATELLAAHGLAPEAMRPAFGMSETCSGITWADEESVRHNGGAAALADLGPPIAGAELRIVGEVGQLLSEGEIGQLQVRGPSVFHGYWPGGTSPPLDADGWFDTGDLGLLRDGRLTLTGRAKNVLVAQGAKYGLEEIEAAADTVAGVEPTFTAALAMASAETGDDELTMLLVVRAAQDAVAVCREVRSRIARQFGINPRTVLAVPAERIAKTSIGKIDRSELKRRYAAGEFQAYAAPQAVTAPTVEEAAQQIAHIWQEMLRRDRLDWDANFFDLGGTSLLLAEVETRLADISSVRVSELEFLAQPTIRGLAQRLAAAQAADPARSEFTSPRYAPARAANSADDDRIAIIGLACRFPGATNYREFWHNLCAGRDSLTRLSEIELLEAGVGPETLNDPAYVRTIGWLDDVELFDAEFFGMNQAEAARIDPSQRLFLQCAWECLEDAGYDPARCTGPVGVFTGAGQNAYAHRAGLVADAQGDIESALIAGSPEFVPLRTSYKLNLTGPSLNVQSNCSSGLAALHLACESLRRGECEIALVGAVSTWLLERRGYRFRPGSLLSPDGQCRPLDARANGLVFSNGVGAVLVKPLARALADGDRVAAVVRATALNNDGAKKIGFLATGIDGQSAVIAAALARAGVSPTEIAHVECHGSGTMLGDAIEVTALARAFASAEMGVAKRSRPTRIGCLSANVGHLGAASGIAGLIKSALILERREIPPVAHYQTPNPHVPLVELPLQVTDRLTPLELDLGKFVGVSSFGVGGTNAHAILEAAPVVAENSEPAVGPRLVVLSARTEQACENSARRLAHHLRQHPVLALADVAFTLQVGRAELPFRRAVVVSSLAELIAVLEAPHDSRWIVGHAPGAGPGSPPMVLRSEFNESDLAACAKQWTQGGKVDWHAFSTSIPGRRVPLPTYPFERQRCWIEAAPLSEHVSGPSQPGAIVPAGDSRQRVAHREQFAADFAAHGDVARLVDDLTRELLRLASAEPLDWKAGFVDLGMSSREAVELIQRLEDALDLRLPLTALLDHPTPADLAECLKGVWDGRR